MSILLGACAAFPGDKIAKIDKLPDVSQYKEKPKVVVDLKLFRGKPNDANAIEINQVQPELQRIATKVLDDSNLFESYTYDLFQQDQADYVVKLHFYNYGENGAAAVMGFLSGFTFGVIPAAATDKYTLKAEVAQNNQSIYVKENQDELTTWIGIWFIPAMANTPQKAMDEVFTNMIKDALNTMIENKQLKYAFIPYPLRVTI
ncbi:hypothetical protein [Catenovulum maritimum]|uniref:hypothetical protein n=1 Tax=Catenovulum maritimum TaxID=1513271 RepID=UPI00122E5B21|nr:hypothetical protein [Catenovulum maritimum]